MDIEELSVFGLYSQKENKVTAALLQLIHSGGVNLFRWILRELKDLSSHLICIANNPIGPEELPAEVMWTDWEGSSCLNNSPTKGINVIIRNPLSTERKIF